MYPASGAVEISDTMLPCQTDVSGQGFGGFLELSTKCSAGESGLVTREELVEDSSSVLW